MHRSTTLVFTKWLILLAFRYSSQVLKFTGTTVHFAEAKKDDGNQRQGRSQ